MYRKSSKVFLCCKLLSENRTFVGWKRIQQIQHIGQCSISYKHQIGQKPLKYTTLGYELEKAAHRWPDRPAVISEHENKTITYSELLDQSNRVAAALLSLGLQKGDRLGIWLPNYSHWIVAMFAATRIGLTSVGINYLYRQNEMKYALKKVGVKALIAGGSRYNNVFYNVLADIIPELHSNPSGGDLKSAEFPDLKHIILIEDNDSPGTKSYENLLKSATGEESERINKITGELNPDSACNIQYTSGTTGNPKAVVLSHYNIVNNSFNLGARNEFDDGYKKILVQVPLFHAYGVVITVAAAVQHGLTLVLPSVTYSPKANTQALLKYKCEVLHGTPTMYVDLVNEVKVNNITGIRSYAAVSGGSPITPKLVQNIKTVLGVEKMKSIFGMTECSAVTFQSLPDEDPDRPLNYLGYIHDHLEAKVIDENNQTVPFGKPGELAIRGYATMTKYWGDPEKTEEIYGEDKWLKTGDQVILHEDGYSQIVGRLKDIIIRGGENIAPKEIEDVMSTHPDVLECQVFGLADERLGEEVCAVVRLKESSSFDERNLKKHVAGRLAKYKVPRLIRKIEEFPKTASGKVQKFKLKAMVESGKL